MYHQLYILRRENRLNQTDLANLLNISRVTYQAKESGKYPFTVPEAVLLANYFDVTLDYLFNSSSMRIKEN